MTLPADEISDTKTPEATGAPGANEASLSKPGADKPNFELVADKDEKIAPKSYAEISAAEASMRETPKAEEPKPETPKAETSKSDVEVTKVEAAKPEPARSEAAKPDAVLGGKALATAGSSPINPFLAAAAGEKVEAMVPPRSIGARLLDYSAHAAIIVGLIGFAWTVSDHVVNRPTKSDTAPVAAAAADTHASAPTAAAPHDEMADLRAANQKMHDEIRALKASVDNLRTTVRHDTTPEQVRMLSAGLDGLKSSLSAEKAETSTAIGQLSGKVDKLQPSKLQQLTERVGRLERQTTDSTATGSLGKSENSRSDAKSEHVDMVKAAPKPPVKPQQLASAEEPGESGVGDKPAVVSGWVVRDVYEGVALIEGKYGVTREVVPGTSIPGAGTVKSIDRKGGGWTVTTTKGQLAYAGATHPAARDYRRGPPGPYGRGYMDGPGPYRYGY